MTNWDILITTQKESEKEIYIKLIKIAKVANVKPLAGRYNLSVSVATKDYAELNRVIEQIKDINGIQEIYPLTKTRFEYEKN